MRCHGFTETTRREGKAVREIQGQFMQGALSCLILYFQSLVVSLTTQHVSIGTLSFSAITLDQLEILQLVSRSCYLFLKEAFLLPAPASGDPCFDPAPGPTTGDLHGVCHVLTQHQETSTRGRK